MSSQTQPPPAAITGIETDKKLTPLEARATTITRNDSSTSSSASSIHEYTPQNILSRPRLGTRKSSGTIIVPRDDPNVELKEGDEIFDEDDARTMSPRRNSEDLEKMSQEARAELSQHAKNLHESLLSIFNRIEAVKEEHDKLDSNNKFLQKYIGDLMSTSKITAGGATGSRKK